MPPTNHPFSEQEVVMFGRKTQVQDPTDKTRFEYAGAGIIRVDPDSVIETHIARKAAAGNKQPQKSKPKKART